jgi:DNA-binding protein HU-beta
MATQMTKSQLIEKIASETELPKKDVKGVFESLATIGYKELKKTGVFIVPGFAKFVVIKKPATKERQGTNPFTKEPMTFKAKPARKIIRARPLKAAKKRSKNKVARASAWCSRPPTQNGRGKGRTAAASDWASCSSHLKCS